MTALRKHSILVNGRCLPADGLPVQTTLLDFLRDRGLTGAKEGCAEGECGACTVAMVAERGKGSAYQPVNSCLMFVPAAVDREFYTVEALAHEGKLAEVQQAMAAAGGSQCGYCTPGFVMSLFAEQFRPGRQGPCDPHALAGNLCRCTGYRPIRDAALSLGPAPEGPFRGRLAEPAPPLKTVEYATDRVRFERPANLAECLSIASRYPDARWICGATDMAVESNLRFRRWPHLISLEGVAALRTFSDEPDGVRIGAALPLGDLELLWTGAPEAVSHWLHSFASPPIRNRATLGGNLATASPIGDSAPLLLALNASLDLCSLGGNRMLPLSSFFSAYRQTRLERAELIRAVEIPRPFPGFVRFYKASKRRMDDISTVAAGLAIDLDGNGRVARAAFAFGGVAPTPLRVFAAEDAALGEPWSESTVRKVQRELERALRPIDDHRGSRRIPAGAGKKSHGEVLLGVEGARIMSAAGGAMPHESAADHVTGAALYTDDLCLRYPQLLHAWPVMSPHPHARVVRLSTAEALRVNGVHAVLTAEDVPGENDTGSNRHDEPLFPAEVMYHGQPVAWVLGETVESARAAANAVRAEYEPLRAILTIRQAIAADSFLIDPLRIANGDLSQMESSFLRFAGELEIGGQEHFYLETQCALARLDETGGVLVDSSTQHPSETQDIVARVLGLSWHQVTVQCLRMGGAFGGKEVQANPWAAVAALGCWKTGRPVRVRLPRALDMALTGKRHPFLAHYEAGFAEDGRLDGIRVALYSDGGWSLDLSGPVISRAMFHIDNAYLLPAAEITGNVCRTHKTSQTAFRGFGGPQGMIVIEEIMSQAAQRLGVPPDLVRERNFYRPGDRTHYGQPVKHAERMHTVWQQLKATSRWLIGVLKWMHSTLLTAVQREALPSLRSNLESRSPPLT